MNEKPKVKLLYDTREQQPLVFCNYDYFIPTRETLVCGDYTIVGHDMPKDDNSIIIERKKDCMELCGNIGTNWETFQKECEKLARYKYKQIIVCSSNNFEFLTSRSLTKLNLGFIYKQLSYIFIEYGISTIFFENRNDAENYIARLFWNIYKKTLNEN